MELSKENMKRALDAANKAYPDKEQLFKENQAYYLGICYEALRAQKLVALLNLIKGTLAVNSRTKIQIEETIRLYEQQL